MVAAVEVLMLCNGRWRPIPPMRWNRKHAGFVIIDNEMGDGRQG